MGINILLLEGMGMFLYIIYYMGMGIRSWEWEGMGSKSHSCTFLAHIVLVLMHGLVMCL